MVFGIFLLAVVLLGGGIFGLMWLSKHAAVPIDGRSYGGIFKRGVVRSASMLALMFGVFAFMGAVILLK